MRIAIIIFVALAAAFALFNIGYTVTDGVALRRKEKRPALAATAATEAVPILPEAEPLPEVEEPTPEPIPEPELMPETLEHIDAEEADALISDTLALKTTLTEHGAGTGRVAIVNIGALDAAFEPMSVITISLLRESGMIPKSAGRLKILADGVLNKPLTVKAESYSIQAIKMIELTGGSVIILKD